VQQIFISNLLPQNVHQYFMVYSVKILCNIQFQIIETLRFPVSLFQPIMQAVDCFVCSPAYSASVAVRNELLFKIWVQLAIYSVLRHTVFEC
jgi:hypothetical protein